VIDISKNVKALPDISLKNFVLKRSLVTTVDKEIRRTGIIIHLKIGVFIFVKLSSLSMLKEVKHVQHVKKVHL
jgi:hypothetical protein